MSQDQTIAQANEEVKRDRGRPQAFDLENTKPTYHDLKRMKQIHHEIALYAVMGYQPGQIAKKLDVTVAMVRYTLNSTLVKRKLEILRANRDAEALDVWGRLEELAPLSVDELEQLLLNPKTNETTKTRIAQDILDRTGYGAIKKVADVSNHLTTDDINEIKEMARENGMVDRVAEAEEADYEDMTPPTDGLSKDAGGEE